MRWETIWECIVDYGYHTLIRTEDMVSCIGRFTEGCINVTRHGGHMVFAKKKEIKKGIVKDANIPMDPDCMFGAVRYCMECGMLLEPRHIASESYRGNVPTGIQAYTKPTKRKGRITRLHKGEVLTRKNTIVNSNLSAWYHPEDCDCEHSETYLREDEITSDVFVTKKTVYTRKAGDPEDVDKKALRDVYRGLEGKDREWMVANKEALATIYKDNADDAGKSEYEHYIPAYHTGTDWVYMDRFMERDVMTEIDAETYRTKGEHRTLMYLCGGHDPMIRFVRTLDEPADSRGWKSIKCVSENGKAYTQWYKAFKTHGDGTLLTNHYKALGAVEKAYKAGDMGDTMYDRLKSLCTYVSGYFWHPRTIRYYCKKNNKAIHDGYLAQVERTKDHGVEEVDSTPTRKFRNKYYHPVAMDDGYDYEYAAREHEAVLQHVYL